MYIMLSIYMPVVHVIAIVEPLYNGQVGAGAFVHYLLYWEVWMWLIAKNR